jgi:hypothetical protein
MLITTKENFCDLVYISPYCLTSAAEFHCSHLGQLASTLIYQTPAILESTESLRFVSYLAIGLYLQ